MTDLGAALPQDPSLSSTAVALAVERLVLAGLEPDPLLRQAGLVGADADMPARGDAAEKQGIFLDTAADVLQDRSLGLHIAQDYELRRLGLFFYLMASSETVGEALSCFERYVRTQDAGLDASYRQSDVALTVAVRPLDVGLAPSRHLSEFLMLSLYRLVTSFTPATPLGVSFVHVHPETAEDTETSFAAPVDFGASENRIAFAVDIANARLPSFDPYLHGSLVRQFEHAAEAAQAEPKFLWSDVKKAMAPRLSNRTATMADIGRDLGMSTRTLSRRLREEGKTFSGVLDELRAELANYYIRIKGLPITEIAWLLGYREASAVVVAFRRWTGLSPTELRRRNEAMTMMRSAAAPDENASGPSH